MEGFNMFFNLFFLFFILSSLIPMIKQRNLEMNRIRLMQQFERKRGSRFISLIHRQEALSFLGFPISKYITIEDSEQILRAIRLTPPDMPIDILLHTPGGLVLASEQIAHALWRHPAKVTVYVPHYAMSGGTLIALAADEIIMDENAVLGPVDPQIGKYPAVSILKVMQTKDKNKIDDETLILADIAEKAVRQVEERVYNLVKDKIPEDKAKALAAKLSRGEWTHDYPITCDQLAELGFPICDKLPKEIYDLMDYYPQPPQRRPSTQYIPVPYFDRKDSIG
nr:ATP-dependent Clp protease proteolytic subunit [Koleobacter methoxysyntrophicus]